MNYFGQCICGIKMRRNGLARGSICGAGGVSLYCCHSAVCCSVIKRTRSRRVASCCPASGQHHSRVVRSSSLTPVLPLQLFLPYMTDRELAPVNLSPARLKLLARATVTKIRAVDAVNSSSTGFIYRCNKSILFLKAKTQNSCTDFQEFYETFVSLTLSR